MNKVSTFLVYYWFKFLTVQSVYTEKTLKVFYKTITVTKVKNKN